MLPQIRNLQLNLKSVDMTLAELQTKLLDIAVDFHQFCEKHQLSYFVCGGSLLGAIRHSGYIPWDDDFDVAMPRVDYEKFLDLWQQEKHRYKLVSTRDPNYLKLGTPAKLHDDSYRLEEKDEEKNGMPKISGYGLFFDIFPLDEYPNTRVGRYLNGYVGQLLIAKHLSQYPNIHRSFKQRFAFSFLKAIPKSWINHLVKRAKQYLQHHTNSDTRWGYGVDTPIINLWIHGDQLFPTKDIAYENLTLKAPANSVAYLSQRYGDYLKLPPESARIPHILKIYKVVE